jgi:lipid A ethanolaminephosphotransferase
LSARPTRRSPLLVVALASAWMAIACNAALWRALRGTGALHGMAGGAFALGVGVLVAAALVALLAPLAWPRILKPVLCALLLLAASGAHFMGQYGIVIDSAMLTNVLQTDMRESADLLGGSLLASMLLLGVLPAWFVCRQPIDYGPWPRRLRGNLLMLAAALVTVVAVVLAAYQPLASTLRGQREIRYLVNPLNTLYAFGRLAAGPRLHGAAVREPLALDAHVVQRVGAAAKPLLLVLVLGETARADHFALNGYARATTPELAALGVSSQRNAWSCGTSTASSVPCMFSHLTRTQFDARAADHETLVDVIQRAGLAVLWLDNQSGCKGVCDRVPNVNTSALPHATLCPDGECLDEVMLEGLDARIAALDPVRRARGTVLVLHQMGSHGPAYFKRSPVAAKTFQPECRSAALQDCAPQSLLNAYDNSIAYTDHLLASTIHWLQQRADAVDAALLYVSDHGESLGERNVYLHGLPYAIAPEAQTHVPWISWLSPEFRERTGTDTACLLRRLDEPVSHGHYFHSVLGLLNVQTAAYIAERDLYRPCRLAPISGLLTLWGRPFPER